MWNWASRISFGDQVHCSSSHAVSPPPVQLQWAPPHISSGRGEAWSQPLLSPSPSPAIPCSSTGHGDGHGSPRTLDTQLARYLSTSLSPLSQYLHTIYTVLTAHNAGLGVVARVQDSPWLRRAQPPHSSQHASTGPAAPYTEAQQHLSRSTHPDSVMTSTSIVLHLCFFVTFWWLPILQMWKKRLKNHIFVIIWNKKKQMIWIVQWSQVQSSIINS